MPPILPKTEVYHPVYASLCTPLLYTLCTPYGTPLLYTLWYTLDTPPKEAYPTYRHTQGGIYTIKAPESLLFTVIHR